MQLGAPKPAIGVVFDSDIGNRLDTAIALSVLYGLDGRNECRVAAISVSKPNLKAAGMAEAFARFYGGTGPFVRRLPVGMAESGPSPEDTPILLGAYTHDLRHVTDTADVAALIRNAYTAYHDQNCLMIVAGPLNNLASALRLPDTRGWAERKVKKLVIAAGHFGSGAPDPRISGDVTSARKVLAEWPTPIVFAGTELRGEVAFPASRFALDFSWSEAHPLVIAHKADAAAADVPMGDVLAVLAAVREQDAAFQLSEPGTVRIGNDGSTTFESGPEGRHRLLRVNAAQRVAIVAAAAELASAKPVVRARPRPPVQQEKPAQPAAPPAANANDPAKPAKPANQ
jgi:hypothetical protein